MQHHAVLEDHPDRLFAFQLELLAIALVEPRRAAAPAAALRQDEELADGDRPAVEMTSRRDTVGHELELAHRADAEAMADGALHLGACGRQELAGQRHPGRAERAVLVAGVEILALCRPGA